MNKEMQNLFYELKQVLVQHSPKWDTLCDIEQYILDLQQENKELTKLVANKVIADYNYDSILKQQLSEERLKYIALEESKKDIENILTEFEKWFNEESPCYFDCNYPVIRKVDICNKLEELKEGKK